MKLKLRVFLTDCSVAMVSFYDIESTITGSPISGRLCDTNIVESLDKE